MQHNRHRKVFVGNISYTGTEEELRTLFSQVGSISSMQLVTEKDTGKRKGFGFVEYLDEEMAQSAVRNLNDIDFHGRPLRVNIADQDPKSTAADATLPSKKRKVGASDSAGETGGCGVTGDFGLEAPAGIVLDPIDPLSNAVSQYDRSELFSAVLGAKTLVLSRPVEAANFFISQVRRFTSSRATACLSK